MLVPCGRLARIESIRPGETLSGTLEEYPLPELLIGMLRGNLSGYFEPQLGNQKNYVYFKDGVPVSVMLPDLEVSLAQILVAFGEMAPDVGQQVQQSARSRGHSESRVISMDSLLADGALTAAMVTRARAQLVRLFDVPTAQFRFTEGEPVPADAELTILQPLPVIFEGLLSSSDRSPVKRFIAKTAGARFRLADTYPRGVDPFEWGDEVEQVVQQLEAPQSASQMTSMGLHPDQVAVALTTLWLADMLDVLEAVTARPQTAAEMPATPLSLPDPARPLSLPDSARPLSLPDPVAQLKEQTRPPQVDAEPTVPTPAVIPPAAVTSSRPASVPKGVEHDAQKARVAAVLGGLRDKNYFEVLRLTPTSSAEQIARSFRYFSQSGGDDDGARALRDLAVEAHHMIVHHADAAKYREYVVKSKDKPRHVRDRLMMEVAPKIERAVSAMADGRTGEADYLLDWAAELDPSRRDLRLHRAFMSFCRADDSMRDAVAKALRPMIASEALKNREDARLQLYFAAVVAELGEVSMARGIHTHTRDHEQPLAQLVARILAKHGG